MSWSPLQIAMRQLLRWLAQPSSQTINRQLDCSHLALAQRGPPLVQTHPRSSKCCSDYSCQSGLAPAPDWTFPSAVANQLNSWVLSVPKVRKKSEIRLVVWTYLARENGVSEHVVHHGKLFCLHLILHRNLEQSITSLHHVCSTVDFLKV